MLNFNNNLTIKYIKEIEISGITIDNKLNFNNHIKSICRKSGQKLCALLRISLNFNMRQKILLHKSVIKSQFSYCPLVWMFSNLFSESA